MNIHATATFAMQGWDEQPYAEFDGGRKLTRTKATFAYEGDIEGKGQVEYLMVYGPDGSGNFVGLERVIGRVGERQGSFVMQHSGTFTPNSVTNRWFIVPGSGTENLQGLSGGGDFSISGHGPYPITFTYSIE